MLKFNDFYLINKIIIIIIYYNIKFDFKCY
jgi:hypothetical protein